MASNKLFDLLRSSSYSAPSALDHNSIFNLGRWPRLLHFAPLALECSERFAGALVCHCRLNDFAKAVKTAKRIVCS
jgi:hypothetical protein